VSTKQGRAEALRSGADLQVRRAACMDRRLKPPGTALHLHSTQGSFGELPAAANKQLGVVHACGHHLLNMINMARDMLRGLDGGDWDLSASKMQVSTPIDEVRVCVCSVCLCVYTRACVCMCVCLYVCMCVCACTCRGRCRRGLEEVWCTALDKAWPCRGLLDHRVEVCVCVHVLWACVFACLCACFL